MGFFGMSYWAPSSFNWMTPKWSIYGLTLTMLGMGTTLTLDDLRGALAMPKELIAGFVLQYTVMPLSGCFLSKLLNLPSHYAAGLILVGCCPGGTASNIVTYLAGGNVALSVLMTAASTLSAVIMTPFLTTKMAGKYVAVDAVGLRNTTLQVVLLPVLAGAFLNQYFSGLVKPVSPLMLSIAVVTVGILVRNAVSQSASTILAFGLQVVLASALLHAFGFFFG
ncbi:probable sodium/metabolite cotransporter BASS1, chloroplastic [Hibiscus syriacus]|uniref:probable sodium/metabolite cotransporter BASS1, chloroplastic n=1 Tax=Hibiscus syriacus TaxID=106335 RepID=UPI001924A0A8|nr:probable sodium/metabolite cotransporter BASS1, chloroplastic [Hibiscus syriacus]